MAKVLDTQSYTLYYHPNSICSIMVAYAWALRGQPKDAESEMKLEFREIDMFRGEQMEEWFMEDFNDLGQIPVMVDNTGRDAPLRDSLHISLFMAASYPNLLPKGKEKRIRQLLDSLHELNFFSLSFSALPMLAQATMQNVESRLADTTISHSYRELLEAKRTLVKEKRVDAVQPREVLNQETKATKALTEIARLVTSTDQWVFGEKPTLLDAHLVVLITRLLEAGKEHLVPQPLREYGIWARNGPEWVSVMGKRRTMPAFAYPAM